MPEATAREMIVADLDDQHRIQPLPLRRPRRRPPAWTARCKTGEALASCEFLQLRRDPFPFVGRQTRRESHVMQDPIVVIEAEQQRSHDLALGRVSEAADHAIRGPLALDLLHCRPFAARIGNVQAFGHHAVGARVAGEPATCLCDATRRRAQHHLFRLLEMRGRKVLQALAAVA